MKIKTLTHKDASWPNALSNISPNVVQLYYRGEIPSGVRLGVIGSRRPTPYGEQVTQSLTDSASRAGAVIVSGMALGIDSIAHKAALAAGGSTIAVLPSDVQRPYPARHRGLAGQITTNGAVLSEYDSTPDVHKANFIARNRIIAALSDVLLVVEASYKSGTMHTVNFALKLGHEVAVVPGRIDSKLSEGTNALARDGAHIITGADDLLQLLGIDADSHNGHKELIGISRDIYTALDGGPLYIGDLEAKLSWSAADISVALTDLELDNLVAKGRDGMYSRR